jgi:hypothetical protein
MVEIAGFFRPLDTNNFLVARCCPLNASGELRRFFWRMLMYGTYTNDGL